MAAENWKKIFDYTIRHEGGYVDHPKDPGGATNLGITIGTLSRWLGRRATKADVKKLTKATVEPIYRAGYWAEVQGDKLPSGVDYAVYDYAINSGPKRAIIGLQRALGVADDGILGPVTRKAAADADPVKVIEGLSKERLDFLRRLSTWKTFGRGWTTRVKSTRRDAIAMAKEGLKNGRRAQPLRGS